MNHGWVLADAALRSYMHDLLPDPIPPGTPPPADLVAQPDRVAAALADSDQIRPSNAWSDQRQDRLNRVSSRSSRPAAIRPPSPG